MTHNGQATRDATPAELAALHKPELVALEGASAMALKARDLACAKYGIGADFLFFRDKLNGFRYNKLFSAHRAFVWQHMRESRIAGVQLTCEDIGLATGCRGSTVTNAINDLEIAMKKATEAMR